MAAYAETLREQDEVVITRLGLSLGRILDVSERGQDRIFPQELGVGGSESKSPERSKMTSGNIPLGPDPDQILEALKQAVRDHPRLRERAAEEMSRELVRGGYLDEEPDPVLVAEMAEGLEAEEESLQPDELSEEGNPT